MATAFNLTEHDLRGAGGGNGDGDGEGDDEGAATTTTMMDKIPILKRRAAGIGGGKGGNDDPICVIVVGMAGSGKTTLMAQLQRSLNLKARARRDGDGDDGDGKETSSSSSSSSSAAASAVAAAAEEEAATTGSEATKTTPTPDTDTTSSIISSSRAGYAINLDPAAKYVPFSSSIDIRDTVDYLEVMRQHKLGPNGAILTCLNLFATKFDQVMDILERRAFGESEAGDGEGGEGKLKTEEGRAEEEEGKASGDVNSTEDPPSTKNPLDYILVDTPGQIEAFTWSASGTIVTSALATAFPTVLAFVVDTPRCAASVHTFMSNMLYACSMLYRAKLPMVVVLNKTDVVGCEFIKEWMDDYESFQEALDDAAENGNGGHSDEMAGGSGYYASLTRSLSLVLDEFYNHLHKVGVSAATGDGVDEFWDVVRNAADEYEDGYLVDLRNRMEEQRAKEGAMRRAGARRLARDLREDGKL